MLLAEKKMEEIEGTMKGWDMLWIEKNNHDQMLLAEKKMEEIEGTMKGWDMLWPC